MTQITIIAIFGLIFISHSINYNFLFAMTEGFDQIIICMFQIITLNV